MFQVEHAVLPHTAFGKLIEGVIVEDVAVLINLNDERDGLCVLALLAPHPRCFTSISSNDPRR